MVAVFHLHLVVKDPLRGVPCATRAAWSCIFRWQTAGGTIFPGLQASPSIVWQFDNIRNSISFGVLMHTS